MHGGILENHSFLSFYNGSAVCMCGPNTVSVTDANNCPSNLDSIIILSNPKLTIDAGNDTLIYFGDTASLLGFVLDSGLAPYSYSWTPTDSLSADSVINPLAFPLDTTTYYITITDSANCQSFDSVIVNVNTPIKLYLIHI